MAPGTTMGTTTGTTSVGPAYRTDLAAARLAAIVDSCEEAIIGETLDGVITDWNPAAERLYGYTAAEVVGHPISTVIPPDRIDEQTALMASLRRGERIAPLETMRVRKDGAMIDVSIIVSPIKDAAGRVVGASVIARDIGEQKRAAAALLTANQRLQETLIELRATQQQVIQQERLRALGTMASGIAHDLNNTLSPVLGFSELLLAIPGNLEDTAKAREYLSLIHTGAQDAAAVVKRLREFYRPREEGRPFTPVSPSRLAEAVVALTQPKWKDQAQAQGRTIDVARDSQPSSLVAGDEGELREALINLVLNAVDAMPEGGTLTLRTGMHDGQVVFEVGDTGVGMTAPMRQRCLEPFFTTKGDHGTGLGLSVVHGIVRRHGGTIEIDSAPGAGTRVRLLLPAIESDADGGDAAAAADGPVRTLRVLIVDDEPSVRALIGAFLHADGHQVIEACDGQEALEVLRHDSFDLVVTDKAMPRLSGDELAEAVKATHPQLPVLMLTGFADMLDVTGQQPEHVDLLLGKPVHRQSLRAAIARLVH